MLSRALIRKSSAFTVSIPTHSIRAAQPSVTCLCNHQWNKRQKPFHESVHSSRKRWFSLETSAPNTATTTLEQHFAEKPKHPQMIKTSVHTEENAQAVFHRIAADFNSSEIQIWTKRLKQRGNRKRLPYHKTLEERVHYVFENGKAKNYIMPPKYLMKALAQFFAGNSVSIEKQEMKNREKFNENVQTLMKARAIAVRHPLLWSNREKKTLRLAYYSTNPHDEQDEQQEEDSDEDGLSSPKSEKRYLADRAASVAALHEWKPYSVLKQEAQELATILADRLPPQEHDELYDLLRTYADSEGNKIRMRFLFANLKRRTKSHVIWIASDVANFFYVDTPDTAQRTNNKASNKEQSAKLETKKEDNESTNDDKETLVTGNPAQVYNSIGGPPKKSSADPRLQQEHKKWNKARSQFVDLLLQLYNSPFSHIWRVTPEMEPTEETAELDILIQRRRERQAQKGPRRKNVHVVFDAIMLQEQLKPEQAMSNTRAGERTVFLDNLPIDIDEDELMQLYSRCGPIESCKLFNQRPDLDPGPLSKSKLKKALKIQRTNNNRRGQRKQGPRRTPVYATISFATQEGYDKASSDALRLFGMVIRKHAVRSTRASDMQTIHLENIPSGFFSADLEHTVSSLLHPNVYMSLGNGFRNYDEPTSCEFRFGSHEAAHGAFEKLEKELNLGSDECTLNWMSTPNDAMEYWTRKRGLVPP